jgi:TPR repeat protein
MKPFRPQAFLLITALLLPTMTAFAGQYEDGVKAYKLEDYTTAIRLLRPLGENGNVHAQWYLGLMFDMGKGVPQDFVEAHKWFDIVSKRSADKYMRDMAIKYRNSVAALMTPAQIAEAQKRASEWKPK